jgi:hypothetical protein
MAIGNEIVQLATRHETAAGEALLQFLQGEELIALNTVAAEVTAKILEEEAAGKYQFKCKLPI